MALRVYICPLVGTGTQQDPFRSKAMQYNSVVTSTIPSKLDGTPAATWTLSMVRDTDFTGIAGDATCDDLFGGDLPATVKTRDDLLQLLRNRTVADVPAARRSAITAVLDKYGIVRADITGTTTLWKVLQRVTSSLLEQDDNFASGF